MFLEKAHRRGFLNIRWIQSTLGRALYPELIRPKQEVGILFLTADIGVTFICHQREMGEPFLLLGLRLNR